MSVRAKIHIKESASIAEAAEILYKLRYYTKIWNDKYGADSRVNKQYWEKKADEFLSENIREIV